jgi:phosphoglycerate dehydrogenase-like enzyme
LTFAARALTFPPMPTVLVTEGSDPTPLEWMKGEVDVVECAYDDPAFESHLAAADGMVVRTYTKVNAALLAKAPRLKVVGRGGVGLENIDVAACRARGVEVVYTPDANTLAVGDFVFGYALQLLRPWNFFRDSVYEPKEFKRIRNTVRGVQLNELTIGILGMGRVGRRVGRSGCALFTTTSSTSGRSRCRSPRRGWTSRRFTARRTSSRCT